MAKRKKTKAKNRRISFKLGKSRKTKQRAIPKPSLKGVFKVVLVICTLAAVGVLFYFAEQYVKSANLGKTGPLELVSVPGWVSDELKARISAAAGGRTFRLDEEAARLVAENLASTAWMADVQVQTTHDRLLVKGRWRRPLALIKRGLQSFYVDAELVVLDFVPVPNLSIVKVKGLSFIPRAPQAGLLWQGDDLAAAVAILARLDRMDSLVTPDKPLLYEIDSIDVSNFNGRQDKRLAHIILYATDNTEIIWGAQIGAWQRHLDASDEEKLAKLYGYYKEYGSLLNGVKYINLRDPQLRIPQPIDKY